MNRRADFAHKVTDTIIKAIVVHGFENDPDVAGIIEEHRYSIQKHIVDALAAYEAETMKAATTENIQRRCHELREEGAKLAYTADLLETLMISRKDAWDELKKESSSGEETSKG